MTIPCLSTQLSDPALPCIPLSSCFVMRDNALLGYAAVETRLCHSYQPFPCRTRLLHKWCFVMRDNSLLRYTVVETRLCLAMRTLTSSFVMRDNAQLIVDTSSTETYLCNTLEQCNTSYTHSYVRHDYNIYQTNKKSDTIATITHTHQPGPGCTK